MTHRQPCQGCGRMTTSDRDRYCPQCFKLLGTTLLGRALADPELDGATVTGSKPNGHAVALPAPQWSVDGASVPDEAPLGIDISAVPAVWGEGDGNE
jgi:hypothetical protein